MPAKAPFQSVGTPKPVSRKYVLDTNVLLHDPTALFRFKEHDLYIPLVVLEELDKHKKGVADIARNARQVTRTLNQLLDVPAAVTEGLTEGFSLEVLSNGAATGRLFFRESDTAALQSGLSSEKADNMILGCAQDLLDEFGADSVAMVTRDINLRVKALALAVPAQDYRSDRVLGDDDILPAGYQAIDDSFWLEDDVDATPTGRRNITIHRQLAVNTFLVERTARGRVRLWRVMSSGADGSVLSQLQHAHPGEGVPLLTAQNEEQQMALNLLHDEAIDFVSLMGMAGSGKTLLALAAGLEQVRSGRFQSILITRATVPMGEEIGFVPGNEEEKMDAWLGGTLRDAYSALNIADERNPLRSKVEVASMSFMRGRSFQGKYIIIDEAQNLTVQQIRALLTRSGEGSKVVVTGNLAQIDTPYLDAGSSGLAWAAKNLQNWRHSGHIILPRGVRSRLATFVEEVASGEATD